GWMLFWAGLFALIALTNMGFYPRSLVGVPGERFSNMGPPTLAIVALTFLQIGLVLVIRPKVLAWLEGESLAQRVVGWINEHAMPLYLFHSTGMAVVVAILFGFGYIPPAEPTLEWWLTRPIWLIGPAIATWPLLALYRVTRRPVASATPKPAD
ncbi:MAG: acyltransferase, partial [bacterium]|nr:acyltransferase [bacterium]